MYTTLDAAKFWDEKYINNETSWDLKGFNPVFEELVKKSDFVKPGKMLVLGCGKGYDAILAAKHGYDVTAVDFSSHAIAYAEKMAAKESVTIKFLNEDIFLLNENSYGRYDYIYEYVTYCSINPERRKEYMEKIESLLKPSGKLIALLFPTDGRKGGPPFSIDIKSFYKDASKLFRLEFSTKIIKSVKPRAGKEILQIYIKT